MKHTIDYGQILETAYLGIRRSAAFMGLGVNAARDPKFKDYSLTKETTCQFLPHDLPDEKIAEIKSDFGKWVVANGFRELIEAFAVFLDKLHEATLLVEQVGGTLNPKTTKLIRDFDRAGIADKLKELTKHNVRCKFQSHIESLWQARNCFTHRRGIVAPGDFNSGQKFVLKWKAIELFLKGASGKEAIVSDSPGSLDEPSNLCLRYVDRSRSFALNEIVTLQPKELAEICIFIYVSTHEVFAGAVAIANSKGINSTKLELTFARRLPS